jgi:hypothetical protein
VTVEADQPSPPVDVSGVDWGLPGFRDTEGAKNLQQQLAAGRDTRLTAGAMLNGESDFARREP